MAETHMVNFHSTGIDVDGDVMEVIKVRNPKSPNPTRFVNE